MHKGIYSEHQTGITVVVNCMFTMPARFMGQLVIEIIFINLL